MIVKLCDSCQARMTDKNSIDIIKRIDYKNGFNFTVKVSCPETEEANVDICKDCIMKAINFVGRPSDKEISVDDE